MRLRHLVTIGPRPPIGTELHPDADVTFVPMEAIADGLGGLDVSQIRPFSEVVSGSYNYFAEGDLLLAKVTPCFENGKKALAQSLSNGIGYATSEVHVIRPGVDRIHPKYLFYLLCSEDFRAGGIASMTGAGGLRRVSDAAVLNYQPSVTNLPTQTEIADFLDRETARIDQLIEKKQRFSSLANERWVSELNDSVFPTFPNWSHLPAEWEKVRLKYLTDPMRPIMYGIVLPGLNVEFGKLIVKGGDVKPGRLDPELLCKTTIEIESTYVRSRVKAGDLIISIRGGIGDLEVVPKTIEGANLTQDAARIAPRSGIDVEWLRYALSAPVVFHLLEAKSLGAAVRGINIFDLKRVFVPTPPSEIQTRIRDSLVAAERRLARLKELVVQHTEKIQEFRSALITAAVTGQIDVSTWSKKGMTERRFDQIEEATSA